MGKFLFRSLFGLITAASALGLAACPQSPWLVGEDLAHRVPLATTPAPVASVQLTGLPTAKQADTSISFAVCADLPDWERAPEPAHLKQLQDIPRYGTAIDSEPLKSLLQKFWDHQVFYFTTYGLSARTEPLYLSGVWTALESTEACYAGDQPELINRGELAEIWLINHRVVSLEWADQTYALTVEPSPHGLQFIQFSRRESDPTLPLQVMTSGGAAVAGVSGDW